MNEGVVYVGFDGYFKDLGYTLCVMGSYCRVVKRVTILFDLFLLD